MRRFDYDDNEDHRKEVDNFFSNDELTPEDYEQFINDEKFDVEFKIVNQEMNHRLLRTSVKIAENSFFWKFYSLDTKLQMIDKIYTKLRILEGLDK